MGSSETHTTRCFPAVSSMYPKESRAVYVLVSGMAFSGNKSSDNRPERTRNRHPPDGCPCMEVCCDGSHAMITISNPGHRKTMWRWYLVGLVSLVMRVLSVMTGLTRRSHSFKMVCSIDSRRASREVPWRTRMERTHSPRLMIRGSSMFFIFWGYE